MAKIVLEKNGRRFAAEYWGTNARRDGTG